MKIYCDSPLLSELVSWLEKKRVARLHAFFPLKNYSTWARARPGWRPTLTNLNKYRETIQEELVDLLFLRRGLNVHHEPDCRRHRKDNAYCCVAFHRKRIEKAPAGDLEAAIEEFRSDWQRALPGVKFPFGWIIDHRDPVRRQQEVLDERMTRFNMDIRRLLAETPATEWNLITEEHEAMTGWAEVENKDIEWGRRLAEAKDEIKRRYVLGVCEKPLLAMMTWARGKPGRHPKEFNVLVYHVIKKCTAWKFDWKRRAAGVSNFYVMRKDGQHRLETDWKLVLFLLLDLHVHAHESPELARFISRYKRQPAPQALTKMQAWLLNIRKNFPPIHGWPMNKEGFPEPETGYRKLIATNEGGLRVVAL